jgi:hypothetical protein
MCSRFPAGSANPRIVVVVQIQCIGQLWDDRPFGSFSRQEVKEIPEFGIPPRCQYQLLPKKI